MRGFIILAFVALGAFVFAMSNDTAAASVFCLILSGICLIVVSVRKVRVSR
jgi:hypothetical protein